MHTDRQALRLRTLRRDGYLCQAMHDDPVFGPSSMKCYRRTSLVALVDEAGPWLLGNVATRCAWHGGSRVET